MLSDMATTGLWGLWLWLCRPALGLLGWMRGGEVQRALAHLLAMTGSTGIERSAIAMGAAGGAMWFWSRLARRRRAMSMPAGNPDYAAHFGLSDAQ
jgi:poly-beta-1,6-N-acetyl-D-glucosamine biosynthesis protein PgaD